MEQETSSSTTHGMTTDGMKLYFEFFKHLTTIDTGSIVLLATFLDKQFPNPRWKFLIGVCLSGFIISLISCLTGMWLIATVLAGEAGEKEVSAGAIAWFMSVVGFMIGIVTLVVFALRNFY